jgi:hypothetical protein
VATNADIEVKEEQSAEGADADACCCFTRAGSFEHITNVMRVMLQSPSKIDMARPGTRDGSDCSIFSDGVDTHRNLPSTPILVLDKERNRTAQRLSVPNSSSDLYAIFLDSHASSAAIALLPAPELVIDEVHIDSHARGQAFKDSN